jgi:uncharacterized protein
MDIKAKVKKLQALYREFEEKARSYREAAVCTVGCADCCINVGNVDAVTLEGWMIIERIKTMDPGRRSRLWRMLEDNARTKQEATYTRCAFLMNNHNCAIYPVRPFSCRRLYSLVRCGESGPTVHRQMWRMAEETVAAIHQLDGGGCSGHLSYVLLLLKDPSLRRVYLDDILTAESLRGFAFATNLCLNSVDRWR